MRLIDADNLIKQLEKCKNNAIGTFPISIVDSNIQLVNNQPTAYDVDKVVGQLEEKSYMTDSTYDEDGFSNDDEYEVIDLNHAIDIVKEGAVHTNRIYVCIMQSK